MQVPLSRPHSARDEATTDGNDARCSGNEATAERAAARRLIRFIEAATGLLNRNLAHRAAAPLGLPAREQCCRPAGCHVNDPTQSRVGVSESCTSGNGRQDRTAGAVYPYERRYDDVATG